MPNCKYLRSGSAMCLLTNFVLLFFFSCDGQEKISSISSNQRTVAFNDHWKFTWGEVQGVLEPGFDDSKWRNVTLPHDASIEGNFDVKNPSGVHGGFLPTGLCYYRKKFHFNPASRPSNLFIAFDGIYRNSEVWLNGHYLGKRPNGFISFQYDLTKYIHYNAENTLVVRVDNLAQPNARWYTGTGIYRNVWLIMTNQVYVEQWGVHIIPQVVNEKKALSVVNTTFTNTSENSQNYVIEQKLLDGNKEVAEASTSILVKPGKNVLSQELTVTDPTLWSTHLPYLYSLVTRIRNNGKIVDEVITKYGFRSIRFVPERGLLLNGNALKIKGVCNHQDLGCLGAAINKSAMRRQLQMLKEMGCNAIRTSHNPPAPELLDLCDEMGFLVMDEAFDVWRMEKTPFDYHWNWQEWHQKDLEDQVKRDRNHPSVFIWSIGNEIPEQMEGNEGGKIATRLRSIVRALDTTRPITAGNNHPGKDNKIISSGALDLIGVNYAHSAWHLFPEYYPGKVFIGTETVSGLQTRGEYSFPPDKIERWGDPQHPVTRQPQDFQCPSFDMVSTPWGSTHEESLKIFKKFAFVSGMFVWTGFDYLGEPSPYFWPSRSSYFGIIDMAGFPKDVYFLYKSEWTNDPTLHIFPHWNWNPGQQVDIWAYYNQADEVELFLNGRSQGIRRKLGEDLHVMWRLSFQPGELKAVSRKNGKIVSSKIIHTAGSPAKIELLTKQQRVSTSDRELIFIEARVTDAKGNIIPNADYLLDFTVSGAGRIIGTDNGNPISHEKFQTGQRKVFHGLALAIIEPLQKGPIKIQASSSGVESNVINVIAE